GNDVDDLDQVAVGVLGDGHVHLDDPATGQRGVGEDDPVVHQDVVGVELAGQDGLDLGEVGERPVGVAVVLGEDHEHAARQAQGIQGGDGVLGAGDLEVPAVDEHDLAGGGPVGERRAQGQ